MLTLQIMVKYFGEFRLGVGGCVWEFSNPLWAFVWSEMHLCGRRLVFGVYSSVCIAARVGQLRKISLHTGKIRCSMIQKVIWEAGGWANVMIDSLFSFCLCFPLSAWLDRWTWTAGVNITGHEKKGKRKRTLRKSPGTWHGNGLCERCTLFVLRSGLPLMSTLKSPQSSAMLFGLE